MNIWEIAKEKWEIAKQKALLWYSTAAYWFLFVNVALFLLACVVAGEPIGPIRYIEFLYHCCHWNAKAGG
jgi:hypothetical protein